MLEGMEFGINPYDWCFTNKKININLCTIVWYVNDNKLSHVNPNMVSEIREEIKKH